MPEPTSTQKIGLSRATSLVMGNMIGAGIFLLPASLAFYGSISFIGWLLSGFGAMFLAIVFSRLSQKSPKTGGPYVYSREAFGDFIGFLAAFGYWMSIVASNAAIAIAFTGYLSIFIPSINESPANVTIASLVLLWVITLINLKGTKTSGTVQLITTIIKVTPLLLISILGAFYVDLDNLGSFNISGLSDFDAMIATITLTLFALMGVESATIPADDIENPDKVIPRATILGTSLVIAIYLLSTFSIMGLIHPTELQNSNAPFADAASFILGPVGSYVVGFGALVSTLGALNGWILIQGQIPMAIARDGLFPKVFSKTNRNGAPYFAIIFSSVLITALILANSSNGLVAMFTIMLQITGFCVSIPYLFSSVAEILILQKSGVKNPKDYIKPIVYAIPAFSYAFWAIAGSGVETVYYGFLLLLLVGVPIYIWSKIKNR